MSLKDEIINYTMTTPENTNPAVLGGLLDKLSSSSGSGLPTPTVEDFGKVMKVVRAAGSPNIIFPEAYVLMEIESTRSILPNADTSYFTEGSVIKLCVDETEYSSTILYDDEDWGLCAIFNNERFILSINTEDNGLYFINQDAGDKDYEFLISVEQINFVYSWQPAPQSFDVHITYKNDRYGADATYEKILEAAKQGERVNVYVDRNALSFAGFLSRYPLLPDQVQQPTDLNLVFTGNFSKLEIDPDDLITFIGVN